MKKELIKINNLMKKQDLLEPLEEVKEAKEHLIEEESKVLLDKKVRDNVIKASSLVVASQKELEEFYKLINFYPCILKKMAFFLDEKIKLGDTGIEHLAFALKYLTPSLHKLSLNFRNCVLDYETLMYFVEAIPQHANTLKQMNLSFDNCHISVQGLKEFAKEIKEKAPRIRFKLKETETGIHLFFSIEILSIVDNIIEERKHSFSDIILKWKSIFEPILEKVRTKSLFNRVAPKLASNYVFERKKEWSKSVVDQVAEYLKKDHVSPNETAAIKVYLQKEGVDDYFDHIKCEILSWVEDKIKQINKISEKFEEYKQLQISANALSYQVKCWALTRAILMQNQLSFHKHDQSQEKLSDIALLLPPKTLSVLTIGRLSQENQIEVKIWYINIIQQSEKIILSILNEALEKLNLGKKIKSHTRKLRKVNGKVIDYYELILTIPIKTVPLSEFMEAICCCLFDLTLKVNVKAVWIGDFDPKNIGNILNLSFNRSYVKPNIKVPDIPGFKTVTWSEPRNRGGKPYYCPYGWLRFGLNVAGTPKEFDKKWGSWQVAYHGSKKEYFYSILTSGLRSATGVWSYDKPVTYLSPSIEYCAHERYAKPFQCGNKWLQMVLQVRVNPKNVQKHGETLLEGETIVFDKNFKNEELEWLVKPESEDLMPGPKTRFHRGISNIYMMKDIIVYGIMIRVTDQNPKEIEELSGWWYKRNK